MQRLMLNLRHFSASGADSTPGTASDVPSDVLGDIGEPLQYGDYPPYEDVLRGTGGLSEDGSARAHARSA